MGGGPTSGRVVAGKRQDKDERQARLAAVQTEQKRARRRRDLWVIGIAVGVALALVVPTALVITAEQRRTSELDAAAAQPIEGLEEYADLTALHTQEPVAYDPSPPVGGDHHPVWQNCGFYDDPVVPEHAVHSLEHGAVWITYDPGADDDELSALRRLADRHPYLLVSPFDGLDAPLVASAWGVQLALDSTEDERLEVFLRAYLQGPQTPEPGAPCNGGVGA